jgi:hypothetical protein
MIATTAPVSDTKQQQHSTIVPRGALHAKKYKQQRDALATLLGQLHVKVKTFKTSLETGELASSVIAGT